MHNDWYDNYKYTKFALDKIAEKYKEERGLNKSSNGENTDPWQRVSYTPSSLPKGESAYQDSANKDKNHQFPEFPGEE